MKILIALLFYFSILSLSSYFLFKNSKEKVTYLFAPLLFIAFDLRITDTTLNSVGEELKFYVNTATILILTMFIFLANKKMREFDIIHVFFILLIINTIWHFFIIKDISSSPYFLRLTLNYLSIYLCFIVSKSISNISINKFLYSFNYLAIANGILGVLQIITKKKLLLGQFNASILYTEGIVDSYRVVGIAGSNNSAGNLAVLLFIISTYNFINKKDYLSFFSALITIVFAILTQTRIALLAILITAIIMYLLSDFDKKGLLKWLPYIVVVISLVIIMLFYDKIYQILFLNRGNTGGERINQLVRAKDYALIDHFWMGIGSGQWRSFLYSNYELVDIPIHSQYLNLWVENGFIIFLCFMAMNAYIFITTLLNRNIEKNKKVFFFSFFIGNIIVSNFNPNQIYTINNILYYFIFFLFYSFYSNKGKSKSI